MNTHQTLSPLWITILALGCGMPATQSDVKLAGVGLTPDQVGAIPDFQGGLIEYNLIDFVPRNLFEQFRRTANFYFLVVLGEMLLVVVVSRAGVAGRSGGQEWR